LDEDDEDIKNLLNPVQSDPSTQPQSREARSSASSKRTRRSSKTSTIHDKNNEFILDEEHLIELLKRLKQQTSVLMTSDDESNLFEALLSMCKILNKKKVLVTIENPTNCKV
jgi:hypothetical protein